mmetsp:Transcript_23490/g.41358  ORF Transcript_23490/g.41358 Transcript_23490/m.41358 type:complete len:278 (+) Transcript_23490:2707-3540(+)
MGKPMHAPCRNRGQRRLDIKPRGREQRGPQRPLAPRAGIVPAKAGGFHNSAHQREPVGMHTVRHQTQQNIALRDACGQGRAPLHRADAETGQIKITRRVHPRHFRCFTTNQGAARGGTALGDAFDDAGGLFQFQLAGGEIVEEKQRLRPLADQIIDAHGHQIDADAVHVARVDGDAQLCAHPIGGRHQNRVGEPSGLQVKKPAKAAQTRGHAGPFCRRRGRFDPVHQGIARINIHARLGIGHSVLGYRHAASLALGHLLDQGGMRCNDDLTQTRLAR